MPRPRASVPPDAFRIEDEVWQEAFTRREPARPRPQPRLHAIDGGRSSAAPAVRTATPASAVRTATPAPAVRTATPAPVRGTAPDPAPAPRTHAAGGVPGRRTVTIRGYGAERNLAWPDASRRPQRRAYERAGFRPDRVALWAVMLGILLVIVAVASPHG